MDSIFRKPLHINHFQNELRLSNANQKLFFDQRPITLQFSNGNQNHKRNNNPFLAAEKEYVPLFLLRDRCKVGVAKVARGKFEILYPNEAQDIISKQRRYQMPPAPQAPAIQVLLKRAYQYQNLLKENPHWTRAELANQVGLDPSVLTRILNLLNLTPEIQRRILKMEPSIYQSPVSERRIQGLARIEDQELQIEGFDRLTAIKPRARHKLSHLRADCPEELAVAHS